MHRILIEGGHPLDGEIVISGAKNSVLPLMVTSLLTDNKVKLSNVPSLTDVMTMAELLMQLGVRLEVDGLVKQSGDYTRNICLEASSICQLTGEYEIVQKMRASILILGPLLARFGEARISLPGGCAIGARPISMHLDAFKAMGAEIDIEAGYVIARAPKGLKGQEINFKICSVGATENVMLGAVLAKGQTIINNAAMEPEIVDLAEMLSKMGAKISGAGTPTIIIEGVNKLHGVSHRVIADRIEAATYAIAAAITKGKLLLKNIDSHLIAPIIKNLQACNITAMAKQNALFIPTSQEISSVDITTSAYPGFPTDLQAQAMALLALVKGSSTITETVFENRFMHVSELNRMGANISVEDKMATIEGVESLAGAEVKATDLRASVSLVLAGLAAKGKTYINHLHHLDRGFERIEDKLSACGAKIKRLYR